MKRLIAAALIAVSSSSFAVSNEEQVGWLGSKELKRIYDAEYGVVCYSTRYDTLSCVRVEKPVPKPKTNRNEDVPE